MIKQFMIQVNPYLEFMNSILLTSRYNEITSPVIGYGLMTEERNEYTSAITNFLEEYRDDQVYKLIESMIPNGFTFSRPIELMLSLGPSKNFEMQFTPSNLCIKYCGGISRISELLNELKIFASRIEFFEFFKTIKMYYSPIISQVNHDIQKYPFISLLENEYGKTQGSYNYVLSALMKGNYGIHFINQKTLIANMFSVFSTDSFSLSPGIIFHEYSHPFINPLTDKYLEVAEQYEEAYELLKPYKLPKYQSGYGDWEECINEHFVRAMSIHLLKKCHLNDMATQFLNNDLSCGYKFIPLILDRYEFYDKHRKIYTDFEKYYPELLRVFADSF